MPGQLDLIGHDGLSIMPEAGRSEPRFWVRRLVIWSEPGEVIREITLRPGLNIIWSPDPADGTGVLSEEDTLGHGSGKTLFCRLIRYCLGEDRFSPDEQRHLITHAFPDGMVGVDVVINGVQWSVIRPIGMGRQHFAIHGVDLEQVISGDFAATGMEPFLEAMETGILSIDVVALIPGEHPLQAWRVALAWLSRDQECRFDKVLDWRSPDSDSGSPVRGWSATRHLDALRALISAIVPEEYRLRAEIGELETRQSEVSQDAARLAWEAKRLRSQLIEALGLNPEEIFPGQMAVEPLRKAAIESLVQHASVDADTDVTDLEALRGRHDEAERQVNSLEAILAEVQGRIPEIEGLIPRIRGEIGKISVHVSTAENPVCPVCEIPIDRVLAEGCKLSHKLPNLEEVRQRQEQLKQELERESGRLQANKAERNRIEKDLAPAREQANTLYQHLRAAEKTQDARSNAWYQERRLMDEVVRLVKLLADHEQAQFAADTLIDEIDKKREQTGAFRDAQASVFARLSRYFDAIIRKMIGPNSTGKVTLDGNGIKLSVKLGGERSTAAIDSLKVIAFDLAVMCMGIEGSTHLPAFLMHDSPREADLGLSVYHRLFHLVHSLEQGEEPSLFQYIVTTTTRPPDEFLREPWLCETLRGSAEERLLRQDL